MNECSFVSEKDAISISVAYLYFLLFSGKVFVVMGDEAFEGTTKFEEVSECQDCANKGG